MNFREFLDGIPDKVGDTVVFKKVVSKDGKFYVEGFVYLPTKENESDKLQVYAIWIKPVIEGDPKLYVYQAHFPILGEGIKSLNLSLEGTLELINNKLATKEVAYVFKNL